MGLFEGNQPRKILWACKLYTVIQFGVAGLLGFSRLLPNFWRYKHQEEWKCQSGDYYVYPQWFEILDQQGIHLSPKHLMGVAENRIKMRRIEKRRETKVVNKRRDWRKLLKSKSRIFISALNIEVGVCYYKIVPMLFVIVYQFSFWNDCDQWRETFDFCHDGVWGYVESHCVGSREIRSNSVISHLDMYPTNVLMYHTMVLLAHPTKVRH